MPGKAQTTGAALEFDVDGSGGGGGGDATAANQVLEIAALNTIIAELFPPLLIRALTFATDSVDVSGSVVAAAVTNFPAIQPVSATNLDIRNLVFATDKVDVSGSTGVGVTGPLTDAQLRLTPVPVSGTVATGGLTDAQLRATPIPISATNLDVALSTRALEAGGNLASIKAKTDNLDVALSTRTKPADQQHVIVDSITAGATVIGKVGIDQTTPGATNLVALAANQTVDLNKVVGTTVDVNSGTKSAGSQRVVVATDDINLAAINAVLGVKTDAAVITNATGTIQQYLRGLVTLAITAGGFLVTATLAAGTALIGLVGKKFTYGSVVTLTDTNWLGLTSGSGWQSDAITTGGASEIQFNLTTFGAAGSTLLCDFYLAEAFTSGNFTDAATGTEGTFTAANRKNSRSLGSIQMNGAASVTGMLKYTDVSGSLPEKVALIGINSSGGTISATGGNTTFNYELIN